MKNGLVISLIFLASFLTGTVSLSMASGLDIDATIRIPVSGDNVESGKSKNHGPPPHAPAHGYRHRNADGVTLEFDSGLGVYVALGLPDIFFSDGHYLRNHDGLWQLALNVKGPWENAGKGDVPDKLKRNSGKGRENAGNGHGHGKKEKK